MKRTNTSTITADQRRLIGLAQARAIVCVSERQYYRDPSVLPKPIRRGRRYLFVESEVRSLIDQMLAERDAS